MHRWYDILNSMFPETGLFFLPSFGLIRLFQENCSEQSNYQVQSTIFHQSSQVARTSRRVISYESAFVPNPAQEVEVPMRIELNGRTK